MKHNMKTRVTELLGVEYPIIQGGMAWVAEHNLAAAVSQAGGLGIIGAGGAPASFVSDATATFDVEPEIHSVWSNV